MLQTQDLRTSQKKELCIQVNIKELNRVSSTGLFTLYMLYYH